MHDVTLLATLRTSEALRIVARAAKDVPPLPEEGGGRSIAAAANRALRQLCADIDVTACAVEDFRRVTGEEAEEEHQRWAAGVSAEVKALDTERSELEEDLERTRRDANHSIQHLTRLWLRDRVVHAIKLRGQMDDAVHARRYLHRGPLCDLPSHRVGWMDEMPGRFQPGSRRGLRTVEGATPGPGREAARERNHTHETICFNDGSVCPAVLVLPCGDSVPLDVLEALPAGVRLASTAKGSVIKQTCDEIAAHVAEQRGCVCAGA